MGVFAKYLSLKHYNTFESNVNVKSEQKIDQIL